MIEKFKTLLLYAGSLIRLFRPFIRAWEALYMILYTGYCMTDFHRFGLTSRIRPKFNHLDGPEYISIGEKCYIGHDIFLGAFDSFGDQRFTPKISVGDNCSLGDYSHITAINEIRIGNNVRMGKNILIVDNAHGASRRDLLDEAPNVRPLSSKGPVIIDDNVWIGGKSSIMPGVHIGRGSIIGAGSVVVKDVPPYSVVAGNPARIIRTLE